MLNKFGRAAVAATFGLLLVGCGSSESGDTTPASTTTPGERELATPTPGPDHMPGDTGYMGAGSHDSLDHTQGDMAMDSMDSETNSEMGAGNTATGMSGDKSMLVGGEEITVPLMVIRGKKQEAGTVTLRSMPDGTVSLTADFMNLPKGKHGFKIVDATSCKLKGDSVKDFNPTNSKHGPVSAGERHVGDLGNIEVSADGTATYETTTNSFTLTEDGASSVLGHAIVVTKRADDGKSQPAGKAGPAHACGVIEAQ